MSAYTQLFIFEVDSDHVSDDHLEELSLELLAIESDGTL